MKKITKKNIFFWIVLWLSQLTLLGLIVLSTIGLSEIQKEVGFGTDIETFKETVKEKDYYLSDIIRRNPSIFNENFKYYYTATKDDVTIIYIETATEAHADSSFKNLKSGIDKNTASISMNNIEKSYVSFNYGSNKTYIKYTILTSDNCEKMSLSKNTILTAQYNQESEEDIEEIFTKLGYGTPNIKEVHLYKFISGISVIVLITICWTALWKVFEKTNNKGWKALVPGYNSYILSKITFNNGWLFLLKYIPIPIKKVAITIIIPNTTIIVFFFFIMPHPIFDYKKNAFFCQ